VGLARKARGYAWQRITRNKPFAGGLVARGAFPPAQQRAAREQRLSRLIRDVPVQQELILTIDVGSSSIRALLYNLGGQAIPASGARRAHGFCYEADGTATDDAETLLASVVACIDEALALAEGLGQIVAVAVDTYAGSLLGLDADGRPLTPVLTYADTRCDDDADALRAELDEASVWERTGCPLRSAYAPARLRWLARTEAATFARVARWMPVGAYLELALLGECRVSFSAASWDGLLDRRALRWDAPLLAHLGLDAASLPPLADAHELLRGLRPAFASRWPALAGVPWLPALGDGAAANIGSGCVRPDRMAVTIGTTGALRVVIAGAPPTPRGLWCYRIDGRRSLLGGATSEGGNLFAWMRESLRLPEGEQLERAIAAVPADSHGLTILPFVAGERSPGYAGNVRATVSGIGARTSTAEIARAGLEAVAYRFGLIAGLLEVAAPAVETVVASGGALLASPCWCQIVADVLGRSLRLSAENEATSRGAALMALEALGIAPIEALPARLGPAFEPDADRSALYRAAMQRQQELYRALLG
jgi:gluconokinase